MTRPDQRLAGVVNLVRKYHPAVVVDTRDGLGEREGDALERVVVVVQDDDAPGVADARAAAPGRPLLRRSDRDAHDGSKVSITASAITRRGRPETWLARRRRANASASESFSFSIRSPLARSIALRAASASESESASARTACSSSWRALAVSIAGITSCSRNGFTR